VLIRYAQPEDHDAIWRILEPTIRAGATYAFSYFLRRRHEDRGTSADGEKIRFASAILPRYPLTITEGLDVRAGVR
jgi:hypothetical protein